MKPLTKLEAEIICDRLSKPDCIIDALEESGLAPEAIGWACDEAYACIEEREFPETATPEIVAVLSDAVEGSIVACNSEYREKAEVGPVIRAGKSAARKVAQWIKEKTGDDVQIIFPIR